MTSGNPSQSGTVLDPKTTSRTCHFGEIGSPLPGVSVASNAPGLDLGREKVGLPGPKPFHSRHPPRLFSPGSSSRRPHLEGGTSGGRWRPGSRPRTVEPRVSGVQRRRSQKFPLPTSSSPFFFLVPKSRFSHPISGLLYPSRIRDSSFPVDRWPTRSSYLSHHHRGDRDFVGFDNPFPLDY